MLVISVSNRSRDMGPDILLQYPLPPMTRIVSVARLEARSRTVKRHRLRICLGTDAPIPVQAYYYGQDFDEISRASHSTGLRPVTNSEAPIYISRASSTTPSPQKAWKNGIPKILTLGRNTATWWLSVEASLNQFTTVFATRLATECRNRRC